MFAGVPILHGTPSFRGSVMFRRPDDPQPASLTDQVQRHFQRYSHDKLYLDFPDSTVKALSTHAPSAWAAWQNDGDFDAAAKFDCGRLIGVRGELSEGGKEALAALDAMLAADRHNTRLQRDLDRAAERVPGPSGEHWTGTNGEPVRLLAPDERMSDLASDQPRGPGLSEFLHAVVTGRGMDKIRNDLGTTPDASGGYSVPLYIGTDFIDRLRAKSALIAAGARTFPMQSKTHRLVRLTADPAVTWRASENAALTPTDPTFGALDLTAKTVAVACKLSIELAQDGVNAAQAATASLVGAMALALDRAALHGATNGPSGLIAVSGRTQVASVGNPSWDSFITGMENLAAADVDLERCNNWIMSPRTWGDLQRLKTGITSDNTPRAMPPAMAGHKLHVSSSVLNTLGAGSDSVVFGGDFSDVVIGVRQDITVRVLNERFADSLSVGLLCWARVDVGVLRPASIVTLEGVTNIA
jgi:HK97 family phage major capsid protein